MALLDNLSKVFNFVVKNEANINKAFGYLTKYGYLDPTKEQNILDIIHAITSLQKTAGIAVTDEINGKTLAVMDWPRCAHKDNVVESASSLNKWGKNKLTYFIAGYDKELSRQDWAGSLREALNRIEVVCNLKFTEVDNSRYADIIYGVGQGRASDFDGASGTLAWMQLAQGSNFNGQLSGKFDVDETWIPFGKTGRGIYLVNVACHETIHALGMEHSKVNSALMAPFYSQNLDRPQQNDDVPRLVNRYGEPLSQPTPTPTPVPNPTPTDEVVMRVRNGVPSVDGYRVIKLG